MGKSLTLKELAELTGSTLVGDPSKSITGIEEIESASTMDATFIENDRYATHLGKTCAGAIFIKPDLKRVEGKNYLLSKNPSLAFQILIEYFLPKIESGFLNIHTTAVIHEEAQLGRDVKIGPRAVIDRGVKVGLRSKIEAGAFIGAEVEIGDDCHIHANAVIREGTKLGNRVVVQSGAVIGSDGFGYHTAPDGKHTPLKHLGAVILEDEVEVGACTTIDRARFKETRIGRGTKIDNLVQIAHQVKMGRDCLIVSQVGIAGSTEIGNNVVLGGQVGIIGHITIGDRVWMAARAAASKSITKPGIYSGAPAIEIREFNEYMVNLRQIKSFIKRLKQMEEKLKEN